MAVAICNFLDEMTQTLLHINIYTLILTIQYKENIDTQTKQAQIQTQRQHTQFIVRYRISCNTNSIRNHRKKRRKKKKTFVVTAVAMHVIFVIYTICCYNTNNDMHLLMFTIFFFVFFFYESNKLKWLLLKAITHHQNDWKMHEKNPKPNINNKEKYHYQHQKYGNISHLKTKTNEFI